MMKTILISILFSVSLLFSQSITENSLSLASVIDEQDPQENIQVDKMPKPVTPVSPKYPESAKKLGVEGMVWLKLVVNEEGNPTKINVVKSNILNDKPDAAKIDLSKEVTDALTDLQNAAIEAAKQWKFTPAVLNGKPIKVWVTVPFKFKLDSGHKEEKK